MDRLINKNVYVINHGFVSKEDSTSVDFLSRIVEGSYTGTQGRNMNIDTDAIIHLIHTIKTRFSPIDTIIINLSDIDIKKLIVETSSSVLSVTMQDVNIQPSDFEFVCCGVGEQLKTNNNIIVYFTTARFGSGYIPIIYKPLTVGECLISSLYRKLHVALGGSQ